MQKKVQNLNLKDYEPERINHWNKAVKKGVYLDEDQFFSRYKHLLTG